MKHICFDTLAALLTDCSPPVFVQAYANAKGVKVVGDMPIYVGGQSADVWANRCGGEGVKTVGEVPTWIDRWEPERGRLGQQMRSSTGALFGRITCAHSAHRHLSSSPLASRQPTGALLA